MPGWIGGDTSEWVGGEKHMALIREHDRWGKTIAKVEGKDYEPTPNGDWFILAYATLEAVVLIAAGVSLYALGPLVVLVGIGILSDKERKEDAAARQLALEDGIAEGRIAIGCYSMTTVNHEAVTEPPSRLAQLETRVEALELSPHHRDIVCACEFGGACEQLMVRVPVLPPND